MGSPVGSFSSLDKFDPNSMTLQPVSCGYTGYVPTMTEWEKNKDYFLPN